MNRNNRLRLDPAAKCDGKASLGPCLGHGPQDIITRMKRMQGYDVNGFRHDYAGLPPRQSEENSAMKESRHDLDGKILKKYGMERNTPAISANNGPNPSRSGLYPRAVHPDEGRPEPSVKCLSPCTERADSQRGIYHQLDPVTQTAPSDIEVVYKEIKGIYII